MPDKFIEVQPELAEGFLGGVETNSAGAVLLPGHGSNDRDPGIRTILFTDVVNSTTLTQLLGDEAALVVLGVHDTIVRDALSALSGREIKHTGDGIMASFVSPASAVRCAIQIQRELDKHAQANPKHPLKVRVGAAVGEPVEQHNDLFGSTVQLAARLCNHAQPEQILVSNAIAELCIGKGLSFEDVGEVTLKGFGSPVRAHAAAWRQ
jgi:class 3 adenylate cyclase